MNGFRALMGSVVLLAAALGGCPADGTLTAPTELDGVVKSTDIFRALEQPVTTATAVEAPAIAEPAVATELVPQPALVTADYGVDAAELEAEVAVGGHGLVAGLGTFVGRFTSDIPGDPSTESPGVFHGRWQTATGDPLGTLHGRYRPLPLAELPSILTGGGIFHGRYVDDDGELIGKLHGRYGYGPDGAGLLFGRWLDRHNRLVGILKGVWNDDPNAGGGHFAGRWAAFHLCSEIDTLPEVAFEPDDFGDIEATGDTTQVDSIITVAAEPDLIRADDPLCVDPNRAHGFLRGWHVPDPNAVDDDAGFFRARWQTAWGALRGRIVGHYRPVDPDEVLFVGDPNQPQGEVLGVFYGKYVDRTGHFRGLVRGVYGVSVHDVGVFRGVYFNPNGRAEGVLLGRWNDDPERFGGPMAGVWFGADLDLPNDPNTP